MALLFWAPLNGNLTNKGTMGNTVTNTGATVDADGKTGLCYSFNGTSSFLSLSTHPLSDKDTFTICMWCYPNDSNLLGLFGCQGGGYYQFVINNNTSAHQLFWRDDSTGVSGTGVTWAFASSITASVWQHWAFTWDKGSVKVYKNGYLVSSTAAVGTTLNSINQTFIGKTPSSSNQKFFNGKINDVRIYDNALTQEEIQKIISTPGFYKNGIISAYDFVEIPNIYNRVEYIQSVGATQYIDTLYPYYSTNNTYEIECDVNISSADISTYAAPYGAYKSESHNTFRIIRLASNTIFAAYSNTRASGGNTSITVSSILDRFYIAQNYNTISLNGTYYTISHSTTGTAVDGDVTFYLFRQTSGTGTQVNTKMYYFSLKDNGEYVRRMFPVVRNSDSKPGLYDTVTGTFFTNAGTGEFTLGPELGNNVGIYSDKIISNDFIEK